MKKWLVLTMVLVLGLTFANGRLAAQDSDPCGLKTFSLSVGVGMRTFSEEAYKDVYDSGGMSFNVELGVKVMGNLEVFLHTDLFSVDGELTYTMEESKMTITPIEVGARYLLKINKDCKPKLFPYIGAGAGYYSVKEENFIGTYDESKLGFFAEGGLRYYIMSSFFADVKFKNVFLKLENDQGDSVEAGGLSYMIGFGISF